MPKREDDYMEAQRLEITRAAFACLLEKGVAGTSLRDICKEAGVSMGAFYVHFACKEDVILAACEMSAAVHKRPKVVNQWHAYIAALRQEYITAATPSVRKRQRLSLQFMAEQLTAANALPGMATLFYNYQRWFRDCLEGMHASGEITLPLGLDATAQVHASLFNGFSYLSDGTPDLDRTTSFDTIIGGFATSAGKIS